MNLTTKVKLGGRVGQQSKSGRGFLRQASRVESEDNVSFECNRCRRGR